MPAPGQPWPLHAKVIACCFHSLAVSCGIFRSTYRWYISRSGWEDTWALLALLTDIGCLICTWVQNATPLNVRPSNSAIALNWIGTFSLTSVPWEARLCMIATIARIANPCVTFRRASYAIAVAFGLMWMAVLAQKLYLCGAHFCTMDYDVGISQLITDVISDAALVAAPTFLLKGVKTTRGQHVLLLSSFASSVCITIVSIVHSVILFMPPSTASLLIAHIKAALSVIICNLLVIVMFVYRVYHKTDVDYNGTTIGSDHVQLTTVVLEQLSLGGCSCTTSASSPCIHCIPSP